MEIYRDPFFWACLSLAAAGAGNAIVSNVLPRSQLLGFTVVSAFMLGRTILVLPFCPQPRFDLAGLHVPVGAALVLTGFALVAPVLRVQWRTGPDASEALRTTGVYGWVRHPGYLGNLSLSG
jgi:protein-S-isoprenylcysteine O-methyltransferase Ste14